MTRSETINNDENGRRCESRDGGSLQETRFLSLPQFSH